MTTNISGVLLKESQLEICQFDCSWQRSLGHISKASKSLQIPDLDPCEEYFPLSPSFIKELGENSDEDSETVK